jgi:AcrR family transcriptional regulator
VPTPRSRPDPEPRRSGAPARRRARGAGYPRGEDTRARLIAAGLDVFGSHGYGGASTRMLADRAGVSLPALQYYFGGKEGAYLACAAHIAAQLQAHLGPALDRIDGALAQSELGRADALATLLGFVDGFAALFLGDHELDTWVLFIIREQAHPTAAFDLLFERVMRRVVQTVGALVARLIERPADDPQTRLRTLALLGQIIFFRTGRAAVLRVMGWTDFGAARLKMAQAALRLQITAALGGTPPPRVAPRSTPRSRPGPSSRSR